MTPAEALAVVREALAYAPFNESEHIRHPAYSALALIEQRLREWERMEERWHSVESKVLMHDDALARAEEAETRMDTYRLMLRDEKARVAELEAALREIAETDALFGGGAMQIIARRALGGGE